MTPTGGMEMVCTCAHGMTFHRVNRGQRLGCGWPKCDCNVYVPVARADAAPLAEQIKAFKPDTSPAAPGRTFVQQNRDSVTSGFMLDMAAKALAQSRLNKLSPQGHLSIAKMAAGTCRVCRGLRELDEAQRYTYQIRRSINGSSQLQLFQAVGHLSAQHVAEIFSVPQDMLHRATLDYLKAHIDDGDEAEDDDELGFVSGFRTWVLKRDGEGRFFLSPPNGHDEPVYFRKVEALHDGNRALALEHLARAREETTLNERDLTVTVRRNSCTCGLYCWTTWDLFCRHNYQKSEQVSANVAPFGVVQMGADGESLRASDMKIMRLVVYLGQTEINGHAMRPQSNFVMGDAASWKGLLPEYTDPTLQAYEALSQRLADQFQCQVDLVKPYHRLNSTFSNGPLEVIKTFQSQVVPVESLWV